jgi:hypothetical protein
MIRCGRFRHKNRNKTTELTGQILVASIESAVISPSGLIVMIGNIFIGNKLIDDLLVHQFNWKFEGAIVPLVNGIRKNL